MSPKNIKVLTVDDSHVLATHSAHVLQDIPWVNHVGHAYTLAEAYYMLATWQPQIIVLDIHLSDENGLDLLRFIKKNNLEMKVIVLSNHVTYPYRTETKLLGADYFLDKSTEFNQLTKVLDEIHTGL